MPTFPVRFDGKPPEITRSPLLGEHTARGVRRWLGLGAGDVAGLKDEGVAAYASPKRAGRSRSRERGDL